MKKYIINIVLVLLFAVLFGGCDQPSIGAGRSQKEAGMGRYVEELMPLPVVSGKEEYPVLPFNMGKSKDGSLKMAALSNKDIYFFTSADHGNTWQPLERMKEAYYSVKYAYPGEMAWTPDGSIFFRAYEQSGEEMIPIYMEVDEAGNFSTLPLKVPEALNLRVGSMAVNNIPINSNLLVSFQCDENGDIYGVDTDRRLMKFSGITGEILYEFDTYDTSVRRCHIAGNILVAEPGDRFWYYDKDSGERFDIQKTAQEKLAGGDLSNIYDTAFCGGTQENEILFYRDGNIYRYMMDGNALELVVDGSYNSLSAPYLEVYWLETFGDEEILILCKTNDEYQLKRFVYREDVPTVPDKELKVYSLARSKYVGAGGGYFQEKSSGHLCVTGNRYDGGGCDKGKWDCRSAGKI